ncbi:phosphotransferase enzyme family protein [Nocardiopsis sp. L17-MgMaSL7]|uniref:phosphotransferase enzyme family protein n=1 Tax=Nocardiopsis sp. L17-MgMaSL7 TaxID=1938893 RepID=UPI000D7194D9|nr:aminoglycoside phosphotransferase family protein [Nocardiopsis sp. L17-MgMaSL7]PWV57605.1 Ser/Thr protein kinase RdoA (MazF antagonist) [Nocardiopsis sp. L17-MgMaSL7]
MAHTEDFTERAPRAVHTAAQALGVPETSAHEGPELIRMGERAVFRLRDGAVIARVERSVARWAEADREVRAARWLAEQGLPVSRPLPGEQPLLAEGTAVTLWEGVQGEWTVPRELARLLHTLHGLTPPPTLDLPDLDHFDRVAERIDTAPGLSSTQRDQLREVHRDLATRLPTTKPVLGTHVIHGDANIGNVLATPHGVVLFDLDGICWGPPEWDLVLTALYRDLGWHSEAEYADFCEAYGFDVTAWEGYPLYKQIRELRMTTWLAQKRGESSEIDAEIDQRINDLADPRRPRAWNPY